MVKPPKSMQPEGIVEDAKSPPLKNPHRGMGEDTFRHYMARKISLQRQQFGIQNHLPPSPSLKLELEPQTPLSRKRKKVSFQEEHEQQRPVEHAMTTLLQRLKRKHGGRKKRKLDSTSHIANTNNVNNSISTVTSSLTKSHRRPDLFFQGIAVLINGYTNPDNETLQRMLHRHGGDFEKYETIRLTHIVASQLSFAKATIYRKRKKPIPIVTPQWIVDCVNQQKLLPHGPYLLENVKEKGTVSVKNFFKGTGIENRNDTDDTPTLSVTKAPSENISSELMETMDDHVDDDVDDDDDYDDDGIRDDANSHTCLTQHEVGASYSAASRMLYTQLQHPPKSPVWSDSASTDQSPQGAPALVSLWNGDHDNEPSSLHPTTYRLSGQVSTAADPIQLIVDEANTEIITVPLGQENETANDWQQSKTNETSCKPLEESIQFEPPMVTELVVKHLSMDMMETKESSTSSCTLLSSGRSTTTTTTAVNSDARPLSKLINGRVRTTGTDPNFLESFFHNSRLSFIGSFQQRARGSPLKLSTRRKNNSSPGGDTHCFILHIDMDCFFAAVVLRNYPQYRNQPVAISHIGKTDGSSSSEAQKHQKLHNSYKSKTGSSSECATCNYEARKYGVQKGMFLGRARELCPSLIVLPYDFDGYEEVSEQVAEILYKNAGLHGGAVEQVSCDEAYMEVNLDGCNMESADDRIRQIGEHLRKEIFSTTQCTATIGIGPNKLLAKLGTDKAKPNGYLVVHDFRELMASLKLRELPGIGSIAERKLASEGILTVKDVWDLGQGAEGELCRILGAATGKKITAFCNGEDDREVKPAARKTIGAECNYGVRFDGPYGVDHLINGLAKEVEKRMLGVEVLGSKLTLKVKQRKAGAKMPPKFLGHGSCHTLSRSIDLPGSVPTNDSQIFARLAMQLFQELGIEVNDVRGMGIVISKLSSSKPLVTLSNRRLNSLFKVNSDTDATITPIALENEADNGVSEESSIGKESERSKNVFTHQEQDIPTSVRDDVSHREMDEDPIEDDIDLPSNSQIRMSQVLALPSPLKRKVSRMLEARDKVIVVDDDDDDVGDDIQEFNDVGCEPTITPISHQWKQTSVRSLFKLAAVKAGKDNLSETLGGSVSLTQLECLPFEMQLELASGGGGGGGTMDSKLSTRKSLHPRKQPKALFPKVETNVESNSHRKYVEPDLVAVQGEEEIHESNTPSPISRAPSLPIMVVSRRSFYQDDIAPLQSFLNESDANDECAKNRVYEFLDVCVQEGRFNHVVKLLRSIKNRYDSWGTAAYREILDKVDAAICEATGCRLDRKWLMLEVSSTSTSMARE